MPLYRNRAAALLAMFAIALQALWPLVVQAKPGTPGERVPVCTMEGITHYIELPAPQSPVEQRSTAQHEHCKMCVFGGAKLAAPSAAASPLALQSRAEAPEAPIATGFFSSSFDRPALPRAPPNAS